SNSRFRLFLPRMLPRPPWTQAADLLLEFDQFLRQSLKAAKLGDFLFGLAYRGGRRQGLSDRLACDRLRELPMWAMARVLGLSTMTVGLTTASGDGGNGTRPAESHRVARVPAEGGCGYRAVRAGSRACGAPGNDTGY